MSEPHLEHFAIPAAKLESDIDKREIVSSITTADIDRGKTVVLPDGIDLKDYRKNPIVQWAHMFFLPPVGRNLWIKPDGNGLVAKTKFADRPAKHEGEWLPDTLLHLYDQEVLRAFSIGVQVSDAGAPTEEELKANKSWKNAERIVRGAALLEYSCCSIPMNQNALKLYYEQGATISLPLARMLGLPSLQDNEGNALDPLESDEQKTRVINADTSQSHTPAKPDPPAVKGSSLQSIVIHDIDEHIAIVVHIDEFQKNSFREVLRQEQGIYFREITGFHIASYERRVHSIHYPQKLWSNDSARSHCRTKQAMTFIPQVAPVSLDTVTLLKNMPPESLAEVMRSSIDLPGLIRDEINRHRGRV